MRVVPNCSICYGYGVVREAYLNCPSCSAPLLFGSTSCNCGYQGISAEDRPLEISYWEALRAWWRIYWPTQLLSIVAVAAFTRWLWISVSAWRTEHPLQRSPLASYSTALTIALSFLLGVVSLWLFTPRILGRPYRGFRMLARGVSGESCSRLTGSQRAQLSFFVWWHQFVGGLAALLLAAPLNMMLGTMGISAAPQITAAAGLFAVGPIVMKMLVGHQLTGFQIEVRRGVGDGG